MPTNRHDLPISATAAGESPPPDVNDDDSPPQYLEVWGDTVVGRHLAISVLVGSVLSVAALLIATEVFTSFVDNESLAEAYALLVGIAFCIVSGVICGKLFRPKRIIATDASEGDAVGDVIQILKDERQGLGTVADLPAATVKELKELDLYDRFVAAEGEPAPATKEAGIR
ncbi:hypothetical protein CH249_19300 [Rhodococcus sp. 05-2255-3B1]|uniref:hypothetical protein n=1 Tax=unclassified Rhodococcus (in: high G+C Gram-positive bacteria) TaxID=192944 RepID=UPI000B9B4D57|nr:MULTISPECIES: hypothetical protein [unclassified Rhodococcus (in: high G+C Gram-positive bacteria)]OZE01685.1 hypothetical protein CH250_26870 [Rhodococcus sp. 05-2255-3C]OZE07285.1 hypothetical protein CH249_19300 [Rhodococcus sp. 05-2255-3B1]OZE17208.1 hypothetical protein CH255_19235 [Rhodococcus sp. 05-2255-2A2]